MTDIAKAYDPIQVEDRWYQEWESRGAFHGDAPDGGPDAGAAYCIMIPPPNVTGVLTMGHVLNNTIQDMLVRRARLCGRPTLWMPGTDHAGIATQTRVERTLRESQGLTRRDLGREAFVKRVWEWREEHGSIILQQLRKLGASCDWRRTVFTLDEAYSRAVRHAFVELYRRGYIYRGKRMVNWCPVTQTALSDEEVIMKPQRGTLYRMRYEIVELPGQFVEISTTRPETLMGDTGVAFHPDDERYRHLHGKHAWRPFPRAAIPFVADPAVDRSFGTGLLKVTPAHDRIDYEIGLRHALPVLDVLNPDGTLNALAGEDFAGLDRAEGRRRAAQKLRQLGLLVAELPYENSVGFSERADVMIEPRLTEQWWMRYPKVEEAKAAVRDGHIRFYPDHWSKTYLHWLDSIQDWCISRQLWWGHRIPVWYRCGADRADPANWHVSVDGPPDPENWEQEEDVLDTWASSWLWPFATLGWPSEDPQARRDLAAFYPTTDLVTGPDIIFFWVARMIMAGLEFMGPEKPTLEAGEIAQRIPFRRVYFTGIIRDAQGRKMSKSLGNSPDPLDLIKRYGADGLRFGIMGMAPKGQDILFNEERVAVGRNFCNKLWNACRFRRMSGPEADNRSPQSIAARLAPQVLDAYDFWILHRLGEALREIGAAFAGYDFLALTQRLYTFFWSDFCDWYVEASKAKLQDPARRDNCLAVQDLVIREVLLNLHPLCPFITEELWHLLGYADGEALLQDTRTTTETQFWEILESAGVTRDPHAVGQVERMVDLVERGRGLKNAHGLSSRRDARFFVVSDPTSFASWVDQAETLKRLMGAASLERVDSAPESSPAVITALGSLHLDLAHSVDVEAERKRLGKELETLRRAIAGAEAKLANPAFTAKAPANVVDGVRETLIGNREKLAELDRLLAALPCPD